jgi:hypothetical protein
MVNARGKNQEIILDQTNAHPVVILAANVKESFAIKNIPNLLVLMQMLVEERLDFFLVDVAHFLGRDGDFVAVFVAAVAGESIDVGDLRTQPVDDAEGFEVGGVDLAARVVVFTLVALGVFNSSVCLLNNMRITPESILFPK